MNKTNTLVSVSIITYNQAEFIAQTLESVIAQITSFDYEILVADDCSTDGTQEILKEYQRRYSELIKLYIQPENVGSTKNSFHNYMAAKGKFIAAVEGDDYWIDNKKLQKQVDFLQNNPQFIAIQDKSLVVDESGEEIDIHSIEESKRFWEFDKNEFLVEDFNNWKMPGQNGGLMYRNIFQREDVDCNVLWQLSRNVGDRTLIMLLLFCGRIHCSNEYTSVYRYMVNSNNYIASQKSNNLRYEEYKLMDSLEDYASKMSDRSIDLSKPKKNTIVGATCIWIADNNAKNKDVLKNIIKYRGNYIRKLLIVLQVVIWKVRCRLKGTDERFPI